MKQALRFFALAFAVTASAQIITPAMPRDGAGLSHSAQATFRANIAAASIAELEQRERSGYLVSDGVTNNRAAGIWVFGSDGAVGGYAITIPFEFVCPTTPPAQSWNIASFGPIHGDVAGVADSLYIRINGPSSGNLTIGCTGATGSDIRNFAYSGFVAAYAGQYVRGVAVFEPGSTTPSVVVVNGESIKDEMSLATSGTPATYLNSNLETTFFLSGSLSPGGVRIWPHAPILGAVTTDEAIAWTRGGDWASWVYRPGSAVPFYSSNFSGGTDGWTTGEMGSVDGNQDGVGGKNDCLKFTTAAGGGNKLFWKTNIQPLGFNQHVSLEVYIPSASTNIDGIAIFSRNLFSENASKFQGLEKDVWHHLTHVSGERANTTGAQNLAISPLDASGASNAVFGEQSFYVRSVVVTNLGSLALPRVQPILALDDRLSRYGARVLGFSPVTFGDSRWRVIGNTATSGNERILGGAVFDDYESVVIDDVVMTCINNNTVTLGSSSGGAQYKTSSALVPGTNVISLVTRLPASASFWVGSDNTYPIRAWITGHMAGMHVNIP